MNLFGLVAKGRQVFLLTANHCRLGERPFWRRQSAARYVQRQLSRAACAGRAARTGGGDPRGHADPPSARAAEPNRLEIRITVRDETAASAFMRWRPGAGPYREG